MNNMSNLGIFDMVLILDGKAPKEQSLLFDLFRAFDENESSHTSDFFSPEKSIFLHACTICSK